MASEILSDKGTHYFIKTAPIMTGGPPRRHKIRRWLCLGGPVADVWRSSEELAEQAPGEYYPFNNAGSSSHSMVYIHRSLLP